MTLGAKKQNNILSFFNPVTKRPPAKRIFPGESLTDERSKGPKRADRKTGSPLSNVESSTPIPSDNSDDGDTIVVQIPPEVYERSRHPIPDPPVSQSFTGSASSSHRIERYGETIVTGSDDDSDDLLDVDRLLDRKPLPSKSLPHTNQEDRIQNKDSKHAYQDTTKADQIAFNSVLAKAKKDLAKSVYQHKALKHVKEFERESPEIPTNQKTIKPTLTAEAIVSHVGAGDAEKTEKFAQVVERIEMTQGVQIWSFFGSTKSDHFHHTSQSSRSDRRRSNRKWPELQKHPEWSIYKDSVQRELAFISGAFEQAAAAHQLPEEIVVWILNQSFVESRADLRDMYSLVLRYADACISSDQILKHAELVLQGLGATREAMSVSSDHIQPKPPDDGDLKPYTIPRDCLCIWLRNVGKLTKLVSIQDRVRILDLLFTLTLDTAVPGDALLLIELQNSLKTVVESLESNEGGLALNQSLRRIYDKAGNVHFRLQFLKCMPTTTYTMARLRKRFAIASFCDSSARLESFPKLDCLQQIGALLKTGSQFQMTSRTNYHDLAAYVACFDIAVGAGERDELVDSTSIQQFNTIIDDLIKIIRTKHARIQTAGAVHMSRTEVKEALMAIERRLSTTVRTKRKRHRNLFDQSTLDGIL
ncbi:MAG: hypothetical protein GOMPHAMPRED_005854 [Gomphillus americanus]|uniref:Uncharacterized protein n=1 Tax=Gomphillus americanus TaxID=1940652 RepID=A0A8H3IS45_9LECA|nr:MAG: hypothetical protein GOMPHAMPRED_005854 [Gomphillus americanus]